MTNILAQRDEWVAEASQAIRAVAPTAGAVADVMRGYALFGRQAPLHARLADGSEWIIDEGNATRLSETEIAERKARMAIYHFGD